MRKASVVSSNFSTASKIPGSSMSEGSAFMMLSSSLIEHKEKKIRLRIGLA